VRVAVCCSVCCSVLQCVAVCCSELQCVAVRHVLRKVMPSLSVSLAYICGVYACVYVLRLACVYTRKDGLGEFWEGEERAGTV